MTEERGERKCNRQRLGGHQQQCWVYKCRCCVECKGERRGRLEKTCFFLLLGKDVD